MKLANVQVVGFDGSPLSEVALHRALRAATEAELPTVHVVMVGERAPRGVRLPSGVELTRFEALMNLRLTVKAIVERWQLDGRFIRLVCHVMVGDATSCILDLAQKYDAERIVLGATGHGHQQCGQVGSVARRTAQGAHCQVALQTFMNPLERPEQTDALRLFLLLGDGFGTNSVRQSPRIATC